jgi:tetratricopeptide (TPR) repeat protein
MDRGSLIKISVSVLLTSLAATAQLRYKVSYQCSGEHIEVAYCRADSDMPGFPRTTDNNNYCLVYYPDRPMRGGFTFQTSELRSEIIKKLQTCGALPAPPGQTAAQSSSASAQTSTSSTGAEAYQQQGEAYIKAQQFSPAVDALKKAIALKPSWAAYNDLGFAYFNLKQYSAAASAFGQAAQLNPNDATVQLNLATAYEATKQYDKALAAAQQSLRLKPNSATTVDVIATIYETSGHYPEAASEYLQAIHLDASLVPAYESLAQLLLKQRRMDDALEVYRVLEQVNLEESNKLFLTITDWDLENKPKSSVSDRAKAYKNLDETALLAKANAGDAAAMKQLSDSYYAKHDTANGLKWELEAARKGDPELQNELGWRYESGSGATKDVSEARKWYAKAGEQGNDTAQLHLCESYAAELGLDDGVVQGPEKNSISSPISPLKGASTSIDEAFRWCVRGGNRGLYHAAWYAGILNARGSEKHPVNFAEAYFWLVNGNIDAGKVFRQKVANHLTEAQRTQVEKLAGAFRPDAMELLHKQLIQRSSDAER